MSEAAFELVLRDCLIFGSQSHCDIAILDGRIAAISGALSGQREIDCDGAFVSSGWVDSHVHVAWSAAAGRIDPLTYGPGQGVCGLVDAGSAPPAKVEALLETRPWVFALANIDSRGIRGEGPAPEVSGAAADEALSRFPERVRGIKVQASQSVLGEAALRAIENAKAVAARHGVPLMVHVGNPPPALSDVCDLLRPGDIITHYAHGKPEGATLAGGAPLPALRRACERGVLLDVGHGRSSFSFRRCRQLLEAGIRPWSISTDLHASSVQAPVVSLARTMSKMLALGVSADEVVAAVTVAPARAFGLLDYGAPVEVGAAATLTAFRLEDRGIEVEDSLGERLTCERWFQPVGCVVGGEWHVAGTPV